MKSSHWTVFYDGHCGFCHATVTFLLKRDSEKRFCFAPLQGETYTNSIDEVTRQQLPDSLIVLSPTGQLTTKSTGTAMILRALPFPWNWLGTLLKIIPKSLRDFGYDIVAKIRRTLFTPPSDLCPLVPQELRSRFLP